MATKAPPALIDLIRAKRAGTDHYGRDLRERAGLSLADVADRVGVTPSTVHYWETGERIPRGECAAAYACVLVELVQALEQLDPAS